MDQENKQRGLFDKVLPLSIEEEIKHTSMIMDDFRSTSERLFEKYREKNENVKYVYKNGRQIGRASCRERV